MNKSMLQLIDDYGEGIKEYIDEVASGSSSSVDVPIGCVFMFSGLEAPNNYLECDGDTYNIEDYPKLAEFYKINYGSINAFGGDGVVTFAVPDYRGEFPRAAGTNTHTDSTYGVVQGAGSVVGGHQDATLQRSIGIGPGNDVYAVKITSDGVLFGNADATSEFAKDGTTISDVAGSTATGGTWSTYYTARPTNTSFLFVVKAK